MTITQKDMSSGNGVGIFESTEEHFKDRDQNVVSDPTVI